MLNKPTRGLGLELPGISRHASNFCLEPQICLTLQAFKASKWGGSCLECPDMPEMCLKYLILFSRLPECLKMLPKMP